MPLPQDQRSPHRQQRWIELENIGETTIPPYAVVEIWEAAKQDTVGTVVQVKRPTMDSSPWVLVNGPQEIPVGARGRVGTNDYPVYVRYNSADGIPLSGEEWGSVKDSYDLGFGRQGFALVGDGMTADGLSLVRVVRSERLLRVTPKETLLPGQSVECYVLRWNLSEWVQTNTIITVEDPLYRTFARAANAYGPGDSFWCEAYGTTFQTVSEFGLRRRGLVMATIQPNSSGLVAIASPAGFGVCQGTLLGPTVDACYRGAPSPLQTDTEVFVHYHPEFRRWFILTGGGDRVRWVQATLVNKMPCETGAQQVKNPINLDNEEDVSSVTQGMNDFKLQAPADSTVLLKWRYPTKDWLIVQVLHRCKKFVTDVRRTEEEGTGTAGCIVYKERVELSYMASEDAAAETAIQFGEQWVVTDVNMSATCRLTQDMVKICALTTGDTATETIATAQEHLVLQDIYQDDLCLVGIYGTGYFFCWEAEVDSNILCGTDCEAPASSTGGALFLAITAVDADYTTTVDDALVNVDSSGGTVTITLHTAASGIYQTLIIKRLGGNTVTINPDGSETIDGDTTLDITTDEKSVMIVSDGTEWKIISAS